MNRVRKFLRLTPLERSLLVKAAFLLAAIRIGFAVLSFERLRRSLRRLEKPRQHPTAEDPQLPEKITRAVTVASRYIPGANTCLIQALAAKVFLARADIPAKLHIGVARGDEGDLKAHAWIEYNGNVVLGELEDLSTFTPLPPIERARE